MSTAPTPATTTTADDNKISATFTVGGRTFKVDGDVNLKFTEIVGPIVPDPEPPTTTDPTKPPTEGTVKKGGWGANMDPKVWVRTVMKDFPDQFKVTDGAKNVATNFKTTEAADNFIKYFQRHPELVSTFFDTDTDDNDDGENHNENFKGVDNPTETIVGPYPMKAGSKQLGSTVRGPTTRNYASGKPSDETIERNTKGIPYKKHQAIAKTTFPAKLEHSDNWTIKIGGDHNTNGWFDNGIEMTSGQSCLGTEKKHPSTDSCVIEGEKVGSLLGKTCYQCNVWDQATNKVELWFKEGDAGQWKKLVEGTDVNNFKSKATGNFEVQQRIDGFEKSSPPTIHWMVVQELD